MSSPPPQEFGQQEEEKQAKDEKENDPDQSPEGDSTPLKPRPKKRQRLGVQKVDQSKIVDIQSLPANPLLEATFQKNPAVKIKAFVGNKVYVVNTGDADVSIPVGALLCGYGRGKFDRNDGGRFNPDCHSMFKIQTCDDLVVHKEKMTTVKDMMQAQRATDPQAKIAYHSVFEVPSTDRDAFGVRQEHEVFFIPAFFGDDDGAQSQQINQGTLAGKLPANIFDNSHCVVATWVVKWSPQGLGPVRPLVIFKKACDLPAGKALSLM